eukprot:9497143-Pyramimonas_sp.AAC.1
MEGPMHASRLSRTPQAVGDRLMPDVRSNGMQRLVHDRRPYVQPDQFVRPAHLSDSYLPMGLLA